MSERLSPLDVSFLYLESAATPMHVGGLGVFDSPAGGFDFARFVEVIGERLHLAPRYRQKIRWVPGRVNNPIWVDDAAFDITNHVRLSSLPRPGTVAQLQELVGRLQGRRLDRSRPLWEINLVDGLEGDRFALIVKIHHAMVDGISAMDLVGVILDSSHAPSPGSARPPAPAWVPRPPPSSAQVLSDAVTDLVRRSGGAVRATRAGFGDRSVTARRLTGLVSAARTAARRAPVSPLNATISRHRRFAVARTELDHYRSVRARVGGTVNDVVLATVTAALRSWLTARGSAPPAGATVRALVPLSVRAGPAGELGNRLSTFFVDLPIGEPEPLRQLELISAAMSAHKSTAQSVGADAVIAMAGITPPPLHALSARIANRLTRLVFNVVVSNVRGPQAALYALGAPMVEMFPIVPLAADQALSIGLTSYSGGVYYGLNADRDAMSDLDRLAAALEQSLTTLVHAVEGLDK